MISLWPIRNAEIANKTVEQRNSPKPFHTVTHREIGDIPGCLPACDIFVAVSPEEMRSHINKRIETYHRLQHTLSHEDFINHPIHRQDYGPAVIKNPSKPYRKDW